MLICTDMEITV